jgi:hypothetical protein
MRVSRYRPSLTRVWLRPKNDRPSSDGSPIQIDQYLGSGWPNWRAHFTVEGLWNVWEHFLSNDASSRWSKWCEKKEKKVLRIHHSLQRQEGTEIGANDSRMKKPTRDRCFLAPEERIGRFRQGRRRLRINRIRQRWARLTLSSSLQRVFPPPRYHLWVSSPERLIDDASSLGGNPGSGWPRPWGWDRLSGSRSQITPRAVGAEFPNRRRTLGRMTPVWDITQPCFADKGRLHGDPRTGSFVSRLELRRRSTSTHGRLGAVLSLFGLAEVMWNRRRCWARNVRRGKWWNGKWMKKRKKKHEGSLSVIGQEVIGAKVDGWWWWWWWWW